MFRYLYKIKRILFGRKRVKTRVYSVDSKTGRNFIESKEEQKRKKQ